MSLMPRSRLTILPVAAAALAVALSGTLPSLATAKKHHHCHICAQPLVPGKSIGPVHLGEPESQVHLGPSVSNQPGTFSYRDYGLTVGYRHGKVVVIVITESSIAALAYQTHTHPIVRLEDPMAHVPSAYPHAQCQHYVLNAPGGKPDLVTDDCVLHDPHNHSGTFFGGSAGKPGPPIDVGLVIVAAAGYVPHLPPCARNPTPEC